MHVIIFGIRVIKKKFKKCQHLVPFPGGMCVIHKLLHSSLLFYPAAVFGNPSVDAGCVYASAAFAPARHTCQEKTPAGVDDRQGPAGVTLRESRTLQSTIAVKYLRLSCVPRSITLQTILKSTVFLIFCFLILSMCLYKMLLYLISAEATVTPMHFILYYSTDPTLL